MALTLSVIKADVLIVVRSIKKVLDFYLEGIAWIMFVIYKTWFE